MVLLITGCSSGIGRLTAETAARKGHTVYASMREPGSRNREAAASLIQQADKERLRIKVIDLDVTKAASVTSAIDRVQSDGEPIDVLVNNAGHMAIGLAESFTEAQVAEQLDVNTMGPFRLCRAVLPEMRQRGSGLIVHVTSILGRVVFPGCGVYCASKWASEAIAEVMHYELAGTGVESVIVEPGPYPTRLLSNSPGPDDAMRDSGYGQLATWRRDFLNQFEAFFASATSTNAQEVADAIVNLIELPAGARPLRSVCGLDYGARAVNEHGAPVQAATLRGFGLEQMAARAAA